jgi:hypothetical protein
MKILVTGEMGAIVSHLSVIFELDRRLNLKN